MIIPYNSCKWGDYAEEKEFNITPYMPKHHKSNSQVERFKGMLVKTDHADKVGMEVGM